jgi:uncharacterized protein
MMRFVPCTHHTGVGLTRAGVRNQGLPIPIDDYLAESDEEELVMYADKLHSKSDPPVFYSADTYSARLRRFGDDKVAVFASMRLRYGEPDFAALQAVHGHALV